MYSKRLGVMLAVALIVSFVSVWGLVITPSPVSAAMEVPAVSCGDLTGLRECSSYCVKNSNILCPNQPDGYGWICDTKYLYIFQNGQVVGPDKSAASSCYSPSLNCYNTCS